jgi:hypothetical protein
MDTNGKTFLAVIGSLLVGLIFYLLGLLPQAAEVAGWGAVIGVVINIAKLFFGDKMDGWAGKISLMANVVLLIILWVADQFQGREQVVAVIGQLGIALPAIFSLLLAMGAAKVAHQIMTWLDGVSFSFTTRKAAALAKAGYQAIGH